MAITRHVYWWAIPRYTSGASQNNTYRVYDGSSYHAITVDADTSDTSLWTSIYGLAAELQVAIRAIGGALATAVVSVDLDTGLLTMTGGSGTIAPAPSTASQKAFDTIIGGSNTTGTPAAAYTMPAPHQFGLYLRGLCVKDYGDIETSVMDSATRLDGTTSVHKWGKSVARSLRYEFLDASQYAQYQDLVASPQGVVLIDDAAEVWGVTTAPNYAVTTAAPSTDRVAPGLEYYHVDIDLGAL